MAILEAHITTPLKAAAWANEGSKSHLRGMCQEFRIGLWDYISCRSSATNAPSALEQSAQVSSLIEKQMAEGFMMGPIDNLQEVAGIITSPLHPKDDCRSLVHHC